MSSTSPSPTTGLSKLSLESMPPTTRSQSQQQSSEAGGHGRDTEHGSERGYDEYDDDEVVRSPTTNLTYSVENLDDETAKLVRELFSQHAQEETPNIVLEWCGFSNDPDVYAFQLQEVVPRAIRIGSPSSSYPSPQCNCMDEGSKPCRHLIWLMDQLTKQTVHDHDPEEELELDEQGFPKKLGPPYRRISDFRVDVLADGLHCDFGPPPEYPEPNPHRVREVREILAAVAGIMDDDVDTYAPEIFDEEPLLRSADIVTRGELEYTILRLLISNNTFFAMFLKLLSSKDKICDPYRKLQQRIERVLNDLHAYSASTANPTSTSAQPPRGAAIEGPRTVAWAARHILHAVEHIHILLSRSDALGPGERSSAARTLVWILKAVVTEHNHDAHPGATQDDRNLYQRLIGNARDSGFVVDTLHLLPDQNQYIDELENIREHVQFSGYQESFMRKLDSLITNLRRRRGSASAGGRGGSAAGGGRGSAGSKRQGPGSSAHDRRAKRAR